MDRGATFDETGAYRYELTRRWGGKSETCLFIMMNPSTAVAFKDDPTIRRCIGFARDWGFHKLAVVNLFAFRTPDVKALKAAAAQVGPYNDEYITENVRRAVRVVCAWGAHGSYKNRSDYVRGEILFGDYHRTFCLGVTKHNEPKHPLYLAADTDLVPFGINGVMR